MSLTYDTYIYHNINIYFCNILYSKFEKNDEFRNLYCCKYDRMILIQE